MWRRTSASCCWLASTRTLAAGWTTSSSRTMVAASEVTKCLLRWLWARLSIPSGLWRCADLLDDLPAPCLSQRTASHQSSTSGSSAPSCSARWGRTRSAPSRTAAKRPRCYAGRPLRCRSKSCSLRRAKKQSQSGAPDCPSQGAEPSERRAIAEQAGVGRLGHLERHLRQSRRRSTVLSGRPLAVASDACCPFAAAARILRVRQRRAEPRRAHRGVFAPRVESSPAVRAAPLVTAPEARVAARASTRVLSASQLPRPPAEHFSKMFRRYTGWPL
jgi:hypothetical protein